MFPFIFKYNIPVELFLLDNYPNQVPKLYLRPTSSL